MRIVLLLIHALIATSPLLHLEVTQEIINLPKNRMRVVAAITAQIVIRALAVTQTGVIEA
jgi:hypothetical protein